MDMKREKRICNCNSEGHVERESTDSERSSRSRLPSSQRLGPCHSPCTPQHHPQRRRNCGTRYPNDCSGSNETDDKIHSCIVHQSPRRQPRLQQLFRQTFQSRRPLLVQIQLVLLLAPLLFLLDLQPFSYYYCYLTCDGFVITTQTGLHHRYYHKDASTYTTTSGFTSTIISSSRSRRSFYDRSSANPTTTTPTYATATDATTNDSTTTTTTTTEETDFGVSNRGDANGAALLIENLNVYRGSNLLLRNIHWRVEPYEKWGLIGPNGCGKSTLLKTIVGEITSYDGTVIIDHTIVNSNKGSIQGGGGGSSSSSSSSSSVGYLQQTAVSGSTKTIYDEVCTAMTDIELARQSLEDIERRVADNDDMNDELLAELDRAMQRYDAVGGYTQEQTVSEMLRGLGFDQNQFHTTTCDNLSGGWQMRVSFAKLLLRQPSLALLDEPSNHLDRPARKWLSKYLKSYEGGAMVLVTHDVELLNACDHIAEITPQGLQMYKSCTYDQYLKLKDQRAISAWNAYEKNMKEAQKLQSFIDRFGASATKASAAQSRLKRLRKMEADGLLIEPTTPLPSSSSSSSTNTQDKKDKDHRDGSTSSLSSSSTNFKPRLILPDPPRVFTGSDNLPLLGLINDAAIGYSGNDRDDDNAATDGVSVKEIASNIDLEIHPGMKILIRGPNGAGKTTLFDTLRGTLPLLTGDRIENPTLCLGVFTQDLAQELDVSARAVDLVTEYARSGEDGDITISNEEARSVMGALGLTGDKALRLVGDLSGGEKARVALSMFALKPSNLYLLDEVSNHLDLECVDALSEALSDWGYDMGSLIVISHDKAFCERIGFTHILTLDGNGGLRLEQRDTNDNDWEASGGLSTQATSQSETTNHNDDDDPNKSKTSLTVELDAKDRKRAFNAPKRIAKIENLIEELEEKIAVIDEDMLSNGSDVGMLCDLTKEKENLQAKVATLMEEWEELETLLDLIS